MKYLIKNIYHFLCDLRKRNRQRKLIYNINKHNNYISENCKLIANSIFEGKNGVGANSVINRCNVGYGSYFGEDCYFERTNIGKYCSIANNVRIVAGEHPTSKWVSTHPAFYSKMSVERFGYINEQKFDEFRFIDENKTFVHIGNDVWIGAEVTILEGVIIGNGAIIAAKSLVAKDVPDYSIVGGVPAKHIKWRFNEAERNFLNEFSWWNKSEKWIKENADLFSDINKMREEYE